MVVGQAGEAGADGVGGAAARGRAPRSAVLAEHAQDRTGQGRDRTRWGGGDAGGGRACSIPTPVQFQSASASQARVPYCPPLARQGGPSLLRPLRPHTHACDGLGHLHWCPCGGAAAAANRQVATPAPRSATHQLGPRLRPQRPRLHQLAQRPPVAVLLYYVQPPVLRRGGLGGGGVAVERRRLQSGRHAHRRPQACGGGRQAVSWPRA